MASDEANKAAEDQEWSSTDYNSGGGDDSDFNSADYGMTGQGIERQIVVPERAASSDADQSAPIQDETSDQGPTESQPETPQETAAIGLLPDDDLDEQVLEMRQVAGLTAGSMMKLSLGRTFEFNESNEGGSFSLRVLDGGLAAILPGTAKAVVDEVEIEDAMLIGDGILNVSSACFSVRPPRPEPTTASRMGAISATFASTSAIAVPPLGTDGPISDDVRRASTLGALLDRNTMTNGPIGRNAWEFLQSIRSTRAVAAERHRLTHPDPEELKTRLTRLDPGLWERGIDHSLFGRFGVGYGTIPWEPRFDSPELIPEYLHDAIVEMSLLPWVPVTANMFHGPVGIVGRRAARLAACRHAILSMAALSSPGAVRLSFVTGRNTTDSWQWTTALPAIMGSESDSSYLTIVLDGIEHLEASGYDEAEAAERRMGMIALAETVEDLPSHCGTILQIAADGTGSVTNHLGETIQVTPIGVTEAYATDLATRIADVLDESLF